MAIVERKRADGSVSFQPRVKDRFGIWFPTQCFADREAAELEELRLVTLKRNGKHVATDDAKKTTVNEYWEVWAIENRGHVSKGWKITQDQMFRDYVAPVIGDLRMIEVSAPDIGRVLSLAQARGLGAQTRKHVYALMNTLFNDAVQYYEMLTASPVKARFHRPRVPKIKRDFLDPSQSWRLLESSKDHYLGPAVWLETLAALRTEAMQGLIWKNVLWDQDMILIAQCWKQKEGRMGFPKGQDWEYVPMIPALKDYLWERWQKSLNPNQFVCEGIRGGMLSYDTFQKAIRKLCERAGVPAVTSHELRHSATELWIQAGASTEDIRRLLNHRSTGAVHTYIHRTDERLTRIGQGVSRPALRVVSETESFPNSFPNGKQEADAEAKTASAAGSK